MKTAGGAVSPYDEVLYPATVFPQTHPNRLATVAFLRGVQPAPINRCRVLELGCGVGSNVIGMAFQLPQSEFIGLDLARRPIATGQAFVAELGLRNISLHSMDLCEAEYRAIWTIRLHHSPWTVLLGPATCSGAHFGNLSGNAQSAGRRIHQL